MSKTHDTLNCLNPSDTLQSMPLYIKTALAELQSVHTLPSAQGFLSGISLKHFPALAQPIHL